MDTGSGLSASECPVCWHELGEGRVPYSLTCGHTLCKLCVKKLIGNNKSITCPLCRELIQKEGIKVNVTLYQLLSQLRQGLLGAIKSSALTTTFDSVSCDVLLDRGASGEVYRGRWQDNDVAIKVFSSGQLSTESQESFRREVCVMNTLRHPNVVLLLAACPTPPKMAIIMEYVGGGSLYYHLYVNKTELANEDIAKLGADVCRGLQYLHSINILHRDLKSKNVLLTSATPIGQAKLCDFGLARLRLESATMTGNIGTVHWTAPEVLNCCRYQFSADIYSLGLVLYEMIARTIPHGNLQPPAVIVSVLIRKLKPVIPADVNPLLASIIDKCISWEPAHRPSITWVLQSLSSLLTRPIEVKSLEESVTFDHTDSLGHVIFDLEFDDETDQDLLGFLQDMEGDSSMDSSMISDKSMSGILSEEELTQYHKSMELPPTTAPSISGYAPPISHPIAPLTATPTSKYTPPSMPTNTNNYTSPTAMPTSSHTPPTETPTSNYTPPSMSTNTNNYTPPTDTPTRNYTPPSMPPAGMHQPPLKTSLEYSPPVQQQGKSHSWSHNQHNISDAEYAMAVVHEERQRQLDADYQLASRLQRREDTIQHTVAPPAPPPPKLPLAQLPFMPEPKQLLFAQITRNRNRRLKSVDTVEKRAFKVGRVVDDDVKYPVTLQEEVSTFNKHLLYQVDFKEPKSQFPIGRVLPDRKYVRVMVDKLQSQIHEFDRKVMRHASIHEKIALPTADDIVQERNLIEDGPYSVSSKINTVSDFDLWSEPTPKKGFVLSKKATKKGFVSDKFIEEPALTETLHEELLNDSSDYDGYIPMLDLVSTHDTKSSKSSYHHNITDHSRKVSPEPEKSPRIKKVSIPVKKAKESLATKSPFKIRKKTKSSGSKITEQVSPKKLQSNEQPARKGRK